MNLLKRVTNGGNYAPVCDIMAQYGVDRRTVFRWSEKAGKAIKKRYVKRRLYLEMSDLEAWYVSTTER